MNLCGEGNSFRVSNNEDDIDGDENHLDACISLNQMKLF